MGRENLCLDRRRLVKLVLKKVGEVVWFGFMWFRTGNTSRLL